MGLESEELGLDLNLAVDRIFLEKMEQSKMSKAQ
jgi:hypothetical protein